MKIDKNIQHLNQSKALESFKKVEKDAKEVAAKGFELKKSDSASLSSSGKIMADAMQALEGTDDTRTELINSLKDQILRGEYKINYDELSKRISSLLD
ncbi:MAG: flagellar biosynthesis anti-sigma factor FlgM [Anaerolineaceae bacterium]|nr:flagellar biosynthesis anti-sigma factor FlgM [Anaerolineaceae bacterium]